MAVERDDNEERLARIEQMLERLTRQHEELVKLVDDSRTARAQRAESGDGRRPKKKT